MYTVQEASPTAAFNSILDQPEVGDERNFVRCKIADEENELYRDDIPISGDRTEVSVLVLIDNSSAKPDQRIHGAHMQLELGDTGDEHPSIHVYLRSDNAETVWDACRLMSTQPVQMSYIPGSARLIADEPDDLPVRDAVIRGIEPLPGLRGNANGEIGGDASNYGMMELRVEALTSG